jgi:hypothetical protein
MSSMDELEPAAAEAIRRLSGSTASGLTRLGGGRNSQVYLVSAAGGGRQVAKVYFRPPDDVRDRLGVEVQALTFFASHGVDDVPSLLGHDSAAGVVLLEYIEGEPLEAGHVTVDHADALAAFAGRLQELARGAANAAIGPASDACFSQDDLVRTIERRVDRLTYAVGETPQGLALRAFLDTQFAPAFERHRQPSPSGAALPRTQWTLSPSDFGFHNVIRRPDGRIAFVDFEYFGWDDPAKMTADVLLHPGTTLRNALSARLSERLRATFAPIPCFGERLAAMLPLCALNWALILLNEFVPAHARRRAFAGDVDVAATRARQLARAEAFLSDV